MSLIIVVSVCCSHGESRLLTLLCAMQSNTWQVPIHDTLYSLETIPKIGGNKNMYKWVRTPSPSFPKANLNNFTLVSASTLNEHDLSSAVLVNTPKLDNTWDKRDMLDSYIHHAIITSPTTMSVSPGTTPRLSRSRSKSSRTDRISLRQSSFDHGQVEIHCDIN